VTSKGLDVRDHDEEPLPDTEPAPPASDPSGGPGRGPSQAQQLMAMAEDTYRLIRSTDGRGYAVPRLGPRIAVPLASRSGNSIRARLAASLHRQTGKIASASALADCITARIREDDVVFPETEGDQDQNDDGWGTVYLDRSAPQVGSS
jgi:hypothetical protein